MPLSNGRRYHAIPGPSVMPDRVLQAMHRPAPDIYAGGLHEMTASLIPDLKAVARSSGEVAIYIANGHATWEAALSNVLSRGDKVLVLATGRFGWGWSEMATGLGIEIEVIDHGLIAPASPEKLEERLRADTAGDIRAVLVCHVDTASSVRSEIPPLRAVLDRLGHPALLMVDCIASLGADRVEMDAWGADVLLSASQKGLMTPPGLGFVWFNDRADRARDRADLASRYWDWRPRVRPEAYYQYFDGTAPTHHLYGLRAALDMIAEEGIEAVWFRHAVLARTVWAAFDRWAQGGPAALCVPDANLRSHAVTAASIGSPHADRLRDWCERVAGVTLGVGLGRTPGDAFFRVGHMGHVNAHMVLGVLASIDAGLKALGIPHGDGALDAAARVVSEVQ